MIRLRLPSRRPGGAAAARRRLPLLLALLLGGSRGARSLAAQQGGAAPGPDAAAGARPTVTAFVHVNVVPMDRERVLADQTVVVRGGRIVALGPAATVRVPAGATRVDGRGKYLIPGLADMHVHLGGLWPREQDSVATALVAFLASGVTTIRDMHSGGGVPGSGARGADAGAWMLGVRARLARGALLGPRLYTAGDPDYASPAAAAASVAKLKADGHDFVKVYEGDTAAVYDSIKASATRVGLRMVGHVPVNGLRWALAAPYASIEHLGGYVSLTLRDSAPEAWRTHLADPKAPWWQPGYRLDTAKLDALATATRRAGAWNCPTLTVWAGTSSLPLKYQIVVSLQRAGAGLLSGTDVLLDVAAWGEKDPLHGQTLAEELALFVAAGLTPYEALQTSTSSVAAFLGTSDSTGTVAVGKRADLVLLSGNPVRDIRQVRAIAGVMAGGRWLPKSELDRRLAAVGTP